MYNDSFDALISAWARSLVKDLNKRQPTYEELEYNCETSITDEDMLRIQIDGAIDSGNKELFLQLTDQLKSCVGYG
ncbi:IDEAL domain-containing protein [Paucisalibacillus globulus]|uniref:IDEAL domain-containing protein n=1 Tax=Paucisalibacillus globulus TaxID=351095 RepID=UPI000BB8C2A5|nr:IDEAL domain-containing protein [Paucisalibacillus globulus]